MPDNEPTPRTTGPRLSVVLVTDHYRTIRRVVSLLRDQRARSQIEIVVVVPAGQPLKPDAGLDDFGGVRCVEVGSITPLGPARAAGVRAATAPVVVIGETHSFPQPGWAEALIEAHARPWAVVVPAFSNANPDSALSWAAFLRDYGPWVDGLPAGEIDFLPPYNTATKREVLLGFGDRLERMVTQGDELSSALRSAGHRVWFEPAARIEHANVARPWPWIVQRYLVGRVIASGRAERWSRLRRLLYACGAPLIPAVILLRLVGAVRQVRRTQRLPAGTLPALVLCTIASATGEMISYAIGTRPDVKRRCDEFELYKLRYTSLPAA